MKRSNSIVEGMNMLRSITMLKKVLCVLVSIIVLLSLTSCSSSEQQEAYEAALQNAASRDYDSAISALQNIEAEYPKAQALLDKVLYAYGCELFNKGDYITAAEKFAASSYKDARNLEYSSYYFQGRSLFDQKKYGEAFSYFNKVPESSEHGSAAKTIREKIYWELIDGQWNQGAITISLARFNKRATVTKQGYAIEQYDVEFPYVGYIQGLYSPSSFQLRVEFVDNNTIEVSGNCSLCSLSGTFTERSPYRSSFLSLDMYKPEGSSLAPTLKSPDFLSDK